MCIYRINNHILEVDWGSGFNPVQCWSYPGVCSRYCSSWVELKSPHRCFCMAMDFRCEYGMAIDSVITPNEKKGDNSDPHPEVVSE